MIKLSFESSALPADTFQILKFDGEEEVSHLFHFELQLVSRDPDIDFDAVLEASAKLAITTQDNTRYLHGMLSEFEQCGEWQNGLYEYRAVVVPRLWIMAQSTQNQIFQNLTVPDIIESELSSIQAKGSHPLVMSGLSVDDYELYMTRNYGEREYTVQYKETDLNFISRLMEHEGIYYYFEHDENREKLVITDTMATEEIAGDSYTEFMTESATARYDRNVVYKLNRAQKQVPDSILVKDFNYRSPSLPMQADSAVVNSGIGFVTEFGAHFKEPEDGEVLATIRAEEYRCRQNMYSGESNMAAFSCGGLYSLGQHFRQEYNQTYMITRVVHHASQDIESWGNVGSTHYHNQFECIPSGLSYRPQRLTPKPKLYGIMNGTIDSELDTGRADLDEQGRYKVMMPFDISGTAPGMASRRIRMAQPYGGGGAGMSFPLVKGTEVIWTCIDGDIDRPIITGAVPNPLNPSVTTVENANSNVIKTSSGITMGFHDGSGSGSANTTGGGAGGGLAAQQQYQNAERPFQSLQQNQVLENLVPSVSTVASDKTKLQSIDQQQQQMAEPGHLAGRTDLKSGDLNFSSVTDYTIGPGKAFTTVVPDYDDAVGAVNTSGSNDCYLRLGKARSWEAGYKAAVWGYDGWLDFTDGQHVSVAKGDRVSITDGNQTDITVGSYTQTKGDPKDPASTEVTWKKGFIWRKLSASWTSTAAVSIGDAESLWGGVKFDAAIGHSTSLNLASSLSAKMTADVALQAGASYTWGSQKSATSLTRDDMTIETHQITAGGRIKLNVKFPDAAAATATSASSIAAVAAIGVSAAAAATVGAAAAVSSSVNSAAQGSAGSVADGIATGVLHTASAAVYSALLAKGIADQVSRKIEGTESVELDMVGAGPALGKIRLGMGSGPTTAAPLPMPGIDITPGMITIGFGIASQIQITAAGINLQTGNLKLDGLTVLVGGAMSTGLKMSAAEIDIGTPATKLGLAGANLKSVGLGFLLD